MKLSNDFIKHLRLFVYYYTNGTLQFRVGDILDIDIAYKEVLINDASNMSLIIAIYMNNIEMDANGIVLNHEHAMKRASQQIRQAIDYTYNVEPAFECWELELHN
ncbi:hypothetical protein SAMN05444411_103186 [Lutibacter oricola]|uniref:DUF7677 domain-containing protein n=1 Tax=Lutibacter oricola TaxID=762486 RepID=A0A1H2ZA35_9FLAO|nr:hypothetical protein [Lutibacter oricola]SDX14177.1 hypothetical protein SAMN05444411_103186 [Lutibacter oricola]